MVFIKIYKKLVKYFKLNFYKNIFTYILFAFTILFFRIVQIEYKIEGFNFIFCTILFLAGLLIFKFYESILKTKFKKSLFTIVIVFIVGLMVVILNGGVTKVINNFLANYKIIQTAFFYSHTTYFYQYINFFFIAVPSLIFIILYLNSKNFGGILIILSFIYISCLWYSSGLIEIRIYALLYMFLCIFSYFYLTYKRSVKKYEKQCIKISIDNNRIINYLLLISILVCILTYISADFFGVKSIYARIEEYRYRNKNIIEMNKNNRYDLLSSGYPNNNQRLGGPIKLDYSKAFRVNADDTYYLKGITKDYYNGFTWSKTENIYQKFLITSINISSINIEKFSEENNLKLLSKTIELYPEGLRTSTIFTPSLTYKIQLTSGEISYNKTKDFMLLGGGKLNSSYKISFFGSEIKDNLIKNRLIKINLGDNLKSTYSQYLQIPDNISPEIYSLVGNITKDCKTSLEKVNKIEDYLSTTYKYSLEVSEVPENKEFINYFLFSEKKGYCTYFASACTMFCRIAGIPARYVEGFKMSEDKDNDGYYVVTNAMSHAWTEVLCDSEKDLWAIVDSVPEAQLQQVISENKSIISTAIDKGAKKIELKIDENKDTDKSSNIKRLFSFKWILYFFLSVIIVSIAVRIVLGIRLIKKILSEHSCIPLYYFIKYRFKLSDTSLIIPEDDYKWINSIEDIELKQSIECLITCMYEEFYGRRSRTNPDNMKIYTVVERYLMKRQLKVKYYITKIYCLITYSEKFIK